MKTDWERLDNAYEVCMFLDSLKEEQIINITGNSGSFYVFYKKNKL